MVAIVAGSGLGLLNTSLNIIGEVGVLGQSLLGQANSRAVANAATGNLVLQMQDEQLAGRGLDLYAQRTHNSLGPLTDGDGDGWRWGYEQTVRFQGLGTPSQPNPGATVVRTDGEGHETTYSWDAARATYVGTEGGGAHDELRYDSAPGEWVWTDGSTRVRERYSNSTSPAMAALLIRRTDTSDNSIELSYDGGRLTLIRDTASGQEIRLRYGLFNGVRRVRRLETHALVEDANGDATETLGDPVRQVEYDYDGSGRLITATRALPPTAGSTFVTTYAYDGAAARVASVTTSDGTAVFFTYDPAGRVSRVTDHGGATDAQLVFGYSPATNRTQIIDGNGQVWTYRYDATSEQLTEIRTPAVGGAALSTRFGYDASGNVVSITDARDNTLTYGYDGNGNRTLERDALGNLVTRTFDAANQMLTQTRYRTSDPDGAGPQVANGPLATRYAYDPNSRLRFAVSPEGRVTENRYGTSGVGSGLLARTLRYTGEVYDVTGLGPAEQLTEAQLAAWVAGLPDNRQAQLTEYRYDRRGNVSRQTSYATVDATGAGVLDDQADVTEYRYDAHARLLRRTVVRGSTRDERSDLASFRYDGMGRVSANTDAEGTRTTVYDNSRITTTTTSGMTETRRYDSRGRLVRVRQTGEATATGETRQTRHVYNNADQLRMTEDAQGGRRYRFYDAAGRPEFSVDATGAVTRSEYNATGQVIRTTQYANRADPSGWYDGGTQTVMKPGLTVGGAGSDVLTDPANDRVTTFAYDAAGRLTTTTDALGVVTTTRYDGASRVTMTQTGDRVTRYLYDKDDRPVGVVDALGYLTEYRYDAAGRLIETVRYGLRGPAAANVSAPVWIGVSNQDATAGKPFECRLPAFDPDGDQPIFGVVGTPPGWLRFDAATATLRGTAPATVGTEHRVTLRAADGRGTTSDVTLRIAVTDPPPDGGPGAAGPTWAALSPLAIRTNTPMSYVIPAATGQSLTYRVRSGLPAGLSFDPATRTISGAASGVGFSTVVLRATNASGRSVDRTLSVRIRPATTPPDQPPGSDQLSAWRPANPRALRSYLYYDGRGRVVGVVDERQFLTETVHDDARNTRRTLRYRAAVTVGPGDTLAGLKSRAGAFRQTSLVQYDGFGRELVTTGPDGSTQTRNEYDAAGRRTRVVTAADTAEHRARRTFFNPFGEATATLGGEGDASLGTSPSPEQIRQAIRDYGTRSEYDTLGRAIRTVDANGNTTLLYYDRENRLTHTVSVVGPTLAGEVNETTYTSFGQAATVRGYATRLAEAAMEQLLVGGGGGPVDPFLLSTLATLADPDVDSVTSYAYDRTGRLVEEVDGEGGITVTSYNLHGEPAAQLRSLSDGRSTTTQLDYDLVGRLVSRTDDVGGINASTQTSYDAFGRPIRSADQAGNVTTTTYRDNGRIVVVTDPLHRATRTDYDAFGRALRVRDALGHDTGYAYDDDARSVTRTTPEKHRVTTASTRHDEPASITDGRGNATAYTYDKDGRQTTVTDPLGRVTTRTTYDRSGRRHEVIDARGTVTRFGYDQRNRVIERRLDPTGSNLTTRFELDALGRQVRVTEGANTATARNTAYLYDRKGRVRTEIVDPAGLRLSTTYGYDHRDNVVTVARGTVSGPNQHVTRHEFDSLGRRTREIAAPSSVFGAGPPGTRDLTTQFLYDVGGRVSRRIAANRMSTWQVYDAVGQLTHTISALGDVSENGYDAVGRPVYRRRCAARLGPSTVDGFGDIVGGGFAVPPSHANDQVGYVVYDDDGRTRFTLTATGGRGWTISENRHDANANIIETRRYDKFLPNARVTAIDSAGSPGITVSEIQAELGTTLGYHDNAPTTLADVPRTRFAYDADNRLRFTVDPLGSIAERTYDPAGNVLSATRFARRPTLTQYTESAIDAAVDRNENDNSVTHSAYDAPGRLRYTVDALGSVTESRYDARDNVVARVRWATRPKLTQYSENAITAALAAMPANGHDITHLVYDAGDRLRFTVDAVGAVGENGYDAVGNVLATTRFAGRPTAPLSAYTESEVDAAVNPLRGDGANQVTRFAHDPSSRLRFTIDALGSVTETVYDGVGNVLVTTRFAVRPVLHQYTEGAIDAAVAALRANGANVTTRFVYDGENRLRYTIDALGSITERSYDTVGNLSRVLRLAVRPALTAYSEGALNLAVAPERDNPDNQLQHSVYDAAGQVRFDVQRVAVEAGQFRYAVTRHDLDALGQTVGTTSYASAVPLSSFSEPAVSAAVGSGDAAKDRVSRFVYDLAGRQSYALLALGFAAGLRRYRVTAQQFDAFDRRVGSTTYATAVAVATFDQTAIAAAVSGVADPTRDRSSAAAYDPLDQVVYDLRLLGPQRHQVTRQEYDALGRVATTIRYARAVGPLVNLDRASIDAAVGAIAGANDRKTLYVYDAAGRQRFALQTDSVPLLTVSENRYDAIGNVVESRRYDRHVTDFWIAAVDTPDSPGVSEHEVLDQLRALGYSDSTPSTLAKLQRTRFAYDTANQRRFTVDALGSVAENRYDALGRVATTVRFAARPTLTAYTESAIEAAVDSDDEDSQLQHRAYDANGQRRFTVDVVEPNVRSGGRHRITEQRYDALGLPVDSRAYATEVGHLTAYDEASIAAAVVRSPQRDRRSATAYDPGGRQAYTVRELVAGSGNAFVVTKHAYDGLGQLVRRVDYAAPVPLVQLDTAAIDGAVHPDPTTDRATTYVYDAAGRLRFALYPDLSFRETGYDALGQVTQTRQFDFRLPSNASRTEAELVTLRGDHTVGDGVTRGQALTYDAAGRLTATRDALNYTERYEYDALDDKTGFIDKNGAKWRYDYDRRGRLFNQFSPMAAVQLSNETAPANRSLQTRFYYDAFGSEVKRLEAAQTVDQRITEFAYDRLGRQIVMVQPGWYDQATGRVEAQSAPGRFQRSLATTYDALGNQVRTKLRTGITSHQYEYKVYDNLGRVVYDVDALSNVAAFSYNAFGEQATVTRHGKSVGTPPGVDAPWSARALATALGNDPLARTMTMRYDKLGRKAQTIAPTADGYFFSGSFARFVPLDSTVTPVSAAGATTFEYNPFGELFHQTVQLDGTRAQETWHYFDTMGRETRTVVKSSDNIAPENSPPRPGGVHTARSYDAVGNLTHVIEYADRGEADNSGNYLTAPPTPRETSTDRINSYVYDACNQQTEMLRSNLSYTALENGQYVQVELGRNDSVKVRHTDYDGVGRVRAATDAMNNVTHSAYNALGQLIRVTEPERSVVKSGLSNPDPFLMNSQVLTSPVTDLVLNAFGQTVTSKRGPGRSDAAGATLITSTGYDFGGNASSTTDAKGNVKNWQYDVFGRVVTQTQAISSTLAARFAAATQNLQVWRVVSHTLERRYAYDAVGRLTDTLDVFSNGLIFVQSGQRKIYNSFGDITEEQTIWGAAGDALSNLQHATSLRNSYDNAGNLVTQDGADGRTQFFYNLTGQVTRKEQRGDNSTADETHARVEETGYDLMGRLTWQSAPVFSSVEGMVTPTTDLFLDRWGNVIGRTEVGDLGTGLAASIRPTSYEYNADNQVISAELGTARALRADGTSYSANVTHRTRYDLGGRAVQQIDVAQDTLTSPAPSTLRTRNTTYDGIGQVMEERDAEHLRQGQHGLRYAYDVNGKKLACVNAVGNVFVGTFDANGNQLTHAVLRLSPGGENDTYVSGSGNVAVAVLLTRHSYDQANRRIETRDYVSTSLFNASYTEYDERGFVRGTFELQETDGSLPYSEDPGRETSYVHDILGNKIGQTDASGHSQAWRYNTAADSGDQPNFTVNRLISTTSTAAVGVANHATAYTYTDFGQLKQETYTGTDITDPAPQNDRVYAYMDNGLLARTTDHQTVGTPGSTGELDYWSATSTNKYFYTDRRLAAGVSVETTGSYEDYAEFGGNIQIKPAQAERRIIGTSYDDRDQPVGVSNSSFGIHGDSNVTYDYDELGNRTRITFSSVARSTMPGQGTVTGESIDGRQLWFDYDHEGRMTLAGKTVAQDGTVTDAGVVITYDAAGRRATTLTREGTEFRGYTDPETGMHTDTESWEQSRLERYTYNDLGYLISIEQAGVRSNKLNLVNNTQIPDDPGPSPFMPSETRSYDLLGNLSQSSQYGRFRFVSVFDTTIEPPALLVTANNLYTATGLLDTQTSTHPSSPRANSHTKNFYDDNGILQSYFYTKGDGLGTDTAHGFKNTYTYSHTFKAGVLREGGIDVESNLHNSTRTQQRNTYDGRGNLVWQRSMDGVGNTEMVFFDYDGSGRVLDRAKIEMPPNRDRISGDTYNSFSYNASGEAIGNVPASSFAPTAASLHANFGIGFTPVSPTYPSSQPSSYAVVAGDSLAGIAKSFLGDAQLWFLIADANGLTAGPDDGLDSQVGRSLRIPNVVTNVHNNAGTFSPYNPNTIVANTPWVGAPKPPPGPSPWDQFVEHLAPIVGTATSMVLAVTLSELGPLGAGIAAAAGDVVNQSIQIGLGPKEWRNFKFAEVEEAALTGLAAGGLSALGSMAAAGGGMAAQALAQFGAAAATYALNNRIHESFHHGEPSASFSGWSLLTAAAGGGATPVVGGFVSGLAEKSFDPQTGWVWHPNAGAWDAFSDELLMGLGQVVIQDSFASPGNSPRHDSAADEPRDALPAELLEAWDVEDRLYTEALDRTARNQQIAEASDESLRLQLLVGEAQSLVDGFGGNIDDRSIIRTVLAERYDARVQRAQAAAARYAASMRIRSANTARFQAQVKAGVRFVSETPDIDAELGQWFAEGSPPPARRPERAEYPPATDWNADFGIGGVAFGSIPFVPTPEKLDPSCVRGEHGLRGEFIRAAGEYRKPPSKYTQPFAMWAADRGDYDAAELFEHYMCPTCHVIGQVGHIPSDDEFSLRGYTESYRRNYVLGGSMVGSAFVFGGLALTVPRVAATIGAWSTGVSAGEAITGRSLGGLNPGRLLSGDLSIGRRLSGGEQILAGVEAIVGAAGTVMTVEPPLPSGRRVPHPNNSLKSNRDAGLYQRVKPSAGAQGHQKWGISHDPATRYGRPELAGDVVEELARGPRSDIADLEKYLYERFGGPLNKESKAHTVTGPNENFKWISRDSRGRGWVGPVERGHLTGAPPPRYNPPR